jgi:Tfp pilus assembly protein PilV
MRRASKRSGFTLVEALTAVVLIAVGIVGTLGSLGAIAKSQSRAMDQETMQRLALQKYDEVAALKTVTSGEATGDFSDQNELRFNWRVDRTATGTGNLDSVLVTVSRINRPQERAEIEGLLCEPPTTSGGKQ